MARSMIAPGEYVFLTRHAAWRFTKSQTPFVEVTGVIVAYYTLSGGVERVIYEQWFHTRKVCVFFETDPDRSEMNNLRLRAIGWAGETLDTLQDDVARGLHTRVSCRHAEDENGQLRERWDLRVFGAISGVKESDELALTRAKEIINGAMELADYDDAPAF